ncbi:unnamed protein product [Phytophthora lilii]|uniref:Unnamed protein product n=1 Tax=Phytophthora lilii TaxID=2077276 RepID=A0A9W6X7E0_9STRA|nr:unnamed protein product [Phytophthora lilii]
MEMARSMIYHKNVEKRWWGKAINTAVYIVNRIPNHLDIRTSPYKIVWGSKPDFSHLRVFGARGFAHIDKNRRKKLDPKAFECIFRGYADAAKAYRVWNVQAGKLVISRSIRLDESEASRYVQVVTVNDNNRNLVGDECDDDMHVESIPVETNVNPEPMDTDEDMLQTPTDLDQMGEENGRLLLTTSNYEVNSPILTTRGVAALENGVVLSETFGGPHGNKYSDLDLAAAGQSVHSITIRSSERVDGVGIDVTDPSGVKSTFYHGGGGSNPNTLTLGAGEYNHEIGGSLGRDAQPHRIKFISFTTSAGNTISGGTPTKNVGKDSASGLPTGRLLWHFW